MRPYHMMLSILIFNAILVYPDVYMKQNQHTDAVQIMGQTRPAGDMTVEVWMTREGFRSDNPEQSVFYRIAEETMVIINHQTETYHELNLGDLDISGAGGKKPEKGNEDFNTLMRINVEVTPTEEKKQIGPWMCHQYMVTLSMVMGQMKIEIWATEELQIDSQLYGLFNAGMLAAMPGMKQTAAKIEK